MSDSYRSIAKTNYVDPREQEKRKKLKKGLIRKAKELKGIAYRKADPNYSLGKKWKYKKEHEVDTKKIVKGVNEYAGIAKKTYEGKGITKKEYIGALKSGQSQLKQMRDRGQAGIDYTLDKFDRELNIGSKTSDADTKTIRKFGKLDPKLDKRKTRGQFSLNIVKNERPKITYSKKNVGVSTMLHELDHMKDYAQRNFVPSTREGGFWKSRQVPTETVVKGATSPKGIGHHSWETGQTEMAQEKHLKTGGSALNYVNIPKVIKGAEERFEKDKESFVHRPEKPTQYETKYGKKLKESNVDTSVMKGDVKDLVDIQGKKEPWEKIPYHKMSDIRVKGISYPEDPKPIKKSLKRLNLM